jgi:uncharacterized protein (DUF983 family)
MRTVTCPRCGSPVPLRRFFSMTNKPFCARCGWNLDRAELALASKSTIVKFIPIGIAAVAFFIFFTASRADMPFIFIVPALFLLIALTPVWSYYSTRKAIAGAKLTADSSLALAQLPLDPSLQMLQSLPRPRRVRFRFAGGIAVAAIGVVFMIAGVLIAFLALSRVNRPHHPQNQNGFAMLILFLVMFVVFVVIIIIPLFREKRNLPLLRDGELAFGRVTAQQTIRQGKASYSKIDYEFQTSSGQLVQNSTKDLTNAVFEGMTIPVFYDPVNPAKNITPCATYLRIPSNPF